MNIIGRITRDAQINTLPNEKQVVNFSVAVNESYRNKQGERIERTEFFNCAYWISTKVAKLLTKGTLVELIGRVSARAWVGSDGEAHAALNFHTAQIKFHGGKPKAEGNNLPNKKTSDKAAIASTTVTAATDNPSDDDLPF